MVKKACIYIYILYIYIYIYVHTLFSPLVPQENKLAALNSSLIQIQKENVQLKEMVSQYSRLITNIRNCPEVNFIKEEMEKFKNCLLI
ncbi:conserved Plasmodium protein, unknown function [Plasmodium ovale]|uniref:Uncharacterized protein n=1 Tax=Plasmodium ovale TaxID=36330 RepID=A0A1C3KNT9_PLAOA|nr:conserved Plasmodium protein, unknown function [Plasmodium ovale]